MSSLDRITVTIGKNILSDLFSCSQRFQLKCVYFDFLSYVYCDLTETSDEHTKFEANA